MTTLSDTRLTSMAAADQHAAGHPKFFPPMPVIQPTCFSRDEVSRHWPQFFHTLDEMQAECEAIGRSPYLSGFIAPRHLLGGGDQYQADGDVLVLNLPRFLAPHLTELVMQEPYVYNRHSLDGQACWTVFAWRAKNVDGQTYEVAVTDNVIQDLLYSGHSRRRHVDFVQLVLVAGEHIVCGGFWFDADDVMGGQAAGICRSSRVEWTTAEWAERVARVVQEGSPEPWTYRRWTDEFGVHHLWYQIWGFGLRSAEG